MTLLQDIGRFISNLSGEDLTFELVDLEHFPYDEYQRNMSRYTEMEDWYNGTELEVEQTGANNKPVKSYPVKINPFPGACEKHVAVLFGDVSDDERPLVSPRLKPVSFENEASDEQKDAAKYAERVLQFIWWANSGRTIQQQNAFLSQIYGGCIFKLSWAYQDYLMTVNGKGFANTPVNIGIVHPKNFIGIPDPSNQYLLSEAWVLSSVTSEQARINYGLEIDSDKPGIMVEHFTRNSFDVTINGKKVNYLYGNEVIPLSGPNPYGFVPLVYIPHIRSSGFYGTNAIDDAIGLLKEYNSRVADYGDAVNIDAHTIVAGSGINGTPKVVEIYPGVTLINLGSTLNVTGNETKPDVKDIGNKRASGEMLTLSKELYTNIRRALRIPPVADGEDEGSQRSGQTLYIRMFPLIMHIKAERNYWSDGLNLLNRMILSILSERKIHGITEEYKDFIVRQDWANPLQLERDTVLNEVSIRKSQQLGSTETLLEILGDVEDIPEELARIEEEKDENAKKQLEQAQSLASLKINNESQNNNKKSNDNGKSKSQGANNDTKAQNNE